MPDQKIIDMKLPVPWLISTAGLLLGGMLTVGWNLSAMSGKIDQVIYQQAEVRKRLDERDTRIEKVVGDIYDLRRISELENMRIETLERKR